MTYIPPDHNHVSPYLVVKQAQPLIDFLIQVFNGKQILRMEGDHGQIMHAEVQIKDSVIMIGEGGENYHPTSSTFHVYVEDADDTYSKALDFGAKSLETPEDKPEGVRRGGVEGPEGNRWYIATRIS